MQLDLATVLVQVATGGLLFCWVTTRRREVGLGYGWLVRITFGTLAILGVVAGLGDDGTGARVRNVAAAVMALAAGIALWVSYVRRGAGVSGRVEQRRARADRVAAMVGTTRNEVAGRGAYDALKEFDPRLDLLAPIAGIVAVAGAAAFVGSDYPLSLARLEIGACFLGAVTDAMLLGHWYLVQPGLGRDPIKEMVKVVAALWPLELLVWLIPTGMVSVLNGSIDDGYDGLIGWMWIVASVTTIGLVVATWFALKERQYSAVMAATGLLYLAILTGFGMDLLPRALLS
ncbi:MAG: hypothetical protein WD271_04060 [Acidimicrobiia bacterium]